MYVMDTRTSFFALVNSLSDRRVSAALKLVPKYCRRLSQRGNGLSNSQNVILRRFGALLMFYSSSPLT